MTPEKKKSLAAYSTSFIIGMFRSALHREASYDLCDDERVVGIDGHDFTSEELKGYLATRPHVMNKKESRESRIARKKSGQKRK